MGGGRNVYHQFRWAELEAIQTGINNLQVLDDMKTAEWNHIHRQKIASIGVSGSDLAGESHVE